MVLTQMMSKTILVIRKPDEFSRILATSGFEIINLPLIETKPLADLSDFETKLENLNVYDGIFLTSQNAARIFDNKIREKHSNFNGKIYVLGEKSFKILRASKLDLVYEKSANTAREMLESIAPENLSDKRFLFIRGEKSLRVVPEFLANLSQVDEIIVYKTREIKVGIDKISILRERFEKGEIAAACFFGPSAAESFLAQFGADILHQIVIAAIGITTAEYFERQNLSVSFVSSKAAAEDFAVELIKFLQQKK